MSMISEQVKKLRDYGDDIVFTPNVRKAFGEAADTIETLSAKLSVKNMERSTEYYGGWVYCGDGEHLPRKPFGCIVTVISTEPTTGKDYEVVLPYHVGYDGKQWNDADGEKIPFEVIAWIPVPEPYHEP